MVAARQSVSPRPEAVGGCVIARRVWGQNKAQALLVNLRLLSSLQPLSHLGCCPRLTWPLFLPEGALQGGGLTVPGGPPSGGPVDGQAGEDAAR